MKGEKRLTLGIVGHGCSGVMNAYKRALKETKLDIKENHTMKSVEELIDYKKDIFFKGVEQSAITQVIIAINNRIMAESLFVQHCLTCTKHEGGSFTVCFDDHVISLQYSELKAMSLYFMLKGFEVNDNLNLKGDENVYKIHINFPWVEQKGLLKEIERIEFIDLRYGFNSVKVKE